MKIGDKVSVLDEDISGEVTAISKNKITIIDRKNKISKFELKPKLEVAEDILLHLSKSF